MKAYIPGLIALMGLAVMGIAKVHADTPPFTQLQHLPAPKVVAAAEAFPGGSHEVSRLFDNNVDTSYASSGKGTATFVEFDFGAPVRLAAFKHVDRNDPATVAASELKFLVGDKTIAVLPVKHVNRPGGVTMATFPEPIQAQRVRWQVTKLGSMHTTVGGAEIVFFTTGTTDATPSQIGVACQTGGMIQRKPGGLTQPVRIILDYPYATPASALVRVDGQEPKEFKLSLGSHSFEYQLPVVETARPLKVNIDYAGKLVVSRTLELKPARKMTVYILPHSHTDIGYTEIQTEIEDKQVNNLLEGMEYARKTADYPPGARFVWNVEVLWAADLYLRRLSEPQRVAFLEAVKNGQVALNGMYLNELTGLCRPEELLRLFRMATQMGRQTGVPVDSAMISDVPGYTWGTVTAMAQAGIKYFSVAPNYFDRIGDILVQWEDKPFYWVGPSAQDKVLVWIPHKGYALSHIQHKLTPAFVPQYQEYLERINYPYDITYLRWSGHGDNARPDPSICDFVKEWSAQYEWPKFVITSTSEAFRAFEKRHGDKLPLVRGDWTPFWEDGAGSSALETAQNRASSDRLSQAETLWAMQQPKTYPTNDFENAWRNVLLYSEHTWGAWCSISGPARSETLEQWSIRQTYANAADLQSRDLLSRALAQGQQAADRSTIDVFNTTSWLRNDLVVVPKYLNDGRQRVLDSKGRPMPSQLLQNGVLVFLARNVPPLAAARYTLDKGPPHVEGKVTAQGNRIENDQVKVLVDEKTGGIIDLRLSGLDANLVDKTSDHAINDYLYLVGDKVADLQRNGPVKITVKEKGPLVASLLVESDAPGCQKLSREIRLVAGMDHVELINLVDRKRMMAANYFAPQGKESVNFAFPFNVPEGQVRLEVPYGVLRPDAEQIPGSCKNWFTVGRWADVANTDYGVTWVTLDAPLVQVGGITATLLNSQTNPAVWRKQVGPTQKLYSWAMNNHWGTNYRAYQEGPITFRFVLRPHKKLDLAQTSRLAIGQGQPLLVTGTRQGPAAGTPRLVLDSPEVILTAFKPSDDGKAIILRLWNAGERDTQTQLTWSTPVPRRLCRSNLGELPQSEVTGPIQIPAWGLVTLRAELAP